MKKFLSILFPAVLVTAIQAAEIVNLSDTGAWREETRLTAQADGSVKVSGRVTLNTVDYLRIHRNKKYTLRGKVRLAPNSPAKTNFGLGFILLNDEERPFPLASFKVVDNSYATLAADVKKGDRVIYVKAENAKAWRAIPGYQVAYKVKRDLSDLPNRNVSGGEGIRKVEATENGTLKVTMHYVFREDIPAGSLVRIQHGYGSNNRLFYLSSLPKEWKEFNVSMSGSLPAGKFDGKGFPVGEEIEALKIFISCNGTTPAAVTELKDLQLIIE